MGVEQQLGHCATELYRGRVEEVASVWSSEGGCGRVNDEKRWYMYEREDVCVCI